MAKKMQARPVMRMCKGMQLANKLRMFVGMLRKRKRFGVKLGLQDLLAHPEMMFDLSSLSQNKIVESRITVVPVAKGIA
jgi:hypothetical protein